MSATHLHPYLMFNGNARPALEHYQRVLGGKLTLQTYGETQGEGMSAPPPELADKIIHGSLDVGDGLVIMASDGQPGQETRVGDNVHLCLVGSDLEKLTREFDGLAEGGTVQLPLARQFWGDTYGQFTDKFGVHWMVNVSTRA